MVVDESGSMAPSHGTTISSINDYLQGLKSTLPADAFVTVVKFTSGWGVAGAPLNGLVQSRHGTQLVKLFDRVKLKDVRPLTATDYTPSGGTPLYDAIGRTMSELDQTIKDHPGPVYFAILTDGEENSSAEYKLETIKQLITQRQEQGWTIAFMGVDIDAYAQGHAFGIRAADTVTLSRDTLVAGIATYTASTTRKFAAAGQMDAATYAQWNATDATFTAEDKSKLESR